MVQISLVKKETANGTIRPCTTYMYITYSMHIYRRVMTKHLLKKKRHKFLFIFCLMATVLQPEERWSG